MYQVSWTSQQVVKQALQGEPSHHVFLGKMRLPALKLTSFAPEHQMFGRCFVLLGTGLFSGAKILVSGSAYITIGSVDNGSVESFWSEKNPMASQGQSKVKVNNFSKSLVDIEVCAGWAVGMPRFFRWLCHDGLFGPSFCHDGVGGLCDCSCRYGLKE